MRFYEMKTTEGELNAARANEISKIRSWEEKRFNFVRL